MFKHNTYVNKDQLSPSKKVLSNFLDGLFVFIISFLLVNFASIPILKNNNHFKEQINDLTSTVCQLYNIQEEAKLSYRVSEEEIYTEGKLFDEYINSHILTSYSYHQEKFNEKQIVIDDLSNKATYENDYLGYYYVNYKYNNNINIEQYNNKTPKQYFVEDIILGSNCASYYETHDDNIPSLTSDVAIDLYQYLNNGIVPFMYYYRNKDGKEIDIILERDGKINPIEVKKSTNPSYEVAKVFKVLDNSSTPRAKRATICMHSDLSAMDSENYIVPVWVI